MIYKFTIKGTLPNLNDYLQAERQTIRRSGRFTTKGNELKKSSQEVIIWAIRQQLKGVHIEKPVMIKYDFFEPNRKRDLDNISAFAHKVIQDSLVLAGVLENDGWSKVVGFEDKFYVDKLNPRIEVILEELEG